jgi:hypothetical protein
MKWTKRLKAPQITNNFKRQMLDTAFTKSAELIQDNLADLEEARDKAQAAGDSAALRAFNSLLNRAKLAKDAGNTSAT